jgi:Ig-like domain from next to BRCA1 gene/Transglycosylase SLT domain
MRRLLIPFVSTLVAANLLVDAPGVEAADTSRASQVPVCVCIPTTAAMAAGFQLAGVGRLGHRYPTLPRIGLDSAIVPPSLLKAVAWIESNWRQFNSDGVPLLSPDFGYGVMQITTGMAGAFGNPTGRIRLRTQARIGGDYLYNIAYAARMLAQYFKDSPAVNNRDPTALEDWYYALWAYNGWGWVNDPNNPAFTRQGTPATDPSTFPYQERIYYLVEHPPLDQSGRSLWTPMTVSLPSDSSIGPNPGHIYTTAVHRELPHVYGATYDVPTGLTDMRAGSSVSVHVTVYNDSGVPWAPSGRPAYALMYHWVKSGHLGQKNYDPVLHGIDVRDGDPVSLSGNVAIGGAIRVAVSLRAPPHPGKYVLDWDMWGRTPGWFSYNSVPPGQQSVRIVPRQASVSPYTDPPLPRYLVGDHALLVASTSGPVAQTMNAGAKFSETFLVFNPGGVGWTSRYRLRLLGSTITIGLPMKFVAPCRTVPLTINGSAPSSPGAYSYIWRVQAPNGHLFGPSLRIGFSVPMQGDRATSGGRFVKHLV